MRRSPGIRDVVLAFVLVSAVGPSARAQTVPSLDDLLDAVSPDADALSLELVEAFLRDAAALRENPVDLNEAGLSELERVPGLDPGSALRIVNAVAIGGPAATLGELWKRADVPTSVAAAIRPYVCVRVARDREGAGSAAQDVAGIPHESGRSIEVRVRTWSSVAAGGGEDPGVHCRARGSVGKSITWGVGIERDTGEPRLVDHAAGYLGWERYDAEAGLSASVTFGDIVASWGQGLVMGRGGFASSTRYPLSGDRMGGYDGSCEWAARRGVAASLSRGPLGCTVLVCRTGFDATVDDGAVTARRTSGHHRTASERAARHAQSEELVAARVVGELSGWTYGATAVSTRFDPAFGAGDAERQHYRFAGSELVVSAVDVRFAGRDWRVGGELAASQDGGVGWVGALRWRGRALSLRCGASSLSHRYWSAAGGGAPGASGGANAWAGWLSARFHAAEGLILESVVEVRGRPWRSYLEPLPDGRTTVSLRAERRSHAWGRVSVEWRERRSWEMAEDEESTVRASARTWRLKVRDVRGLPLSASVVVCSEAVGGLVRGHATGYEVGWTRSTEGWSVDAGVAGLTREGGVALMRWTPGLPGEMGLGGWDGGVSWWVRGSAAWTRTLDVMIRAAGSGGEVSLGGALVSRGLF